MKTTKTSKLALTYSDKIDRYDYSGKDCLMISIAILHDVSEDSYPKWRNPSASYISSDESYPQYADMTITAIAKKPDTLGSYGWTISYHDIYQLDASRAELCAKTLRAIDKKLDKMTEQEGSAQTFGQYVNRVARAIGADRMITWSGKTHNYTEDMPQYSRLGDIAYHIDTRIADFQANKTEEQAA